MSKIKLVRLRGRNQITLPPEVLKALSLEEGDYLAAVTGDDGIIRLRPAKLNVAGTPEAERAIARAEADLESGRSKKLASLPELKEEIHSGHREQLREMEARGSSMLVQVGPQLTMVTIQRENKPLMTRGVPIGSKTTGLISKLAREIRLTLEFFQGTLGGPGVGKVFLSVVPRVGEGMAEGLRKELGIRVEEAAELRPEERKTHPGLKGMHFYPSVNLTYDVDKLGAWKSEK